MSVNLALNLAVVRGVCSSPAEVRVLPSGSTLVVLQVTTRADDGVTTSVPVVVWDPPTATELLDEGDEVVVVGRVRRRFFRTGAGSASRVEIEAEQVVPAANRRRVRGVIRKATARIEAIDE